MKKILLIGQTPPPFGGQTISIKSILDGNYKTFEIVHVRMAFSKEMNEVGNFKIKKLLHLLNVIFNIILVRIRHKIDLFNYPPAGPDRLPMYRDFVILLVARNLFKKTSFYFYANGISELYSRLSRLEKCFFRRAYFNADLAMHQSEFIPLDGKFLQAKRNIVFPLGAEDVFPRIAKERTLINPTPVILFVGVLRESKGVLVLLDACRRLRDSGFIFKTKLMGKFASNQFRAAVEAFLDEHGLREIIEFLGVLSGDQKWQVFGEADIFVFPSFFESEGIPVAVLEAMQFEIPVVATLWRGIPSAVEEGGTGFLVPIRDSQAVADKLVVLLKNEGLREEMGKRGRQRYLSHFTVEKFRRNMEEAFLSVV